MCGRQSNPICFFWKVLFSSSFGIWCKVTMIKIGNGDFWVFKGTFGDFWGLFICHAPTVRPKNPQLLQLDEAWMTCLCWCNALTWVQHQAMSNGWSSSWDAWLLYADCCLGSTKEPVLSLNKCGYWIFPLWLGFLFSSLVVLELREDFFQEFWSWRELRELSFIMPLAVSH